MIKFKSITLKNFLSFGNVPTVIVLDRPGTTLVVGEDLDNTSTGTGANGVGKFQHVDCLVKTPNGWIRMGDIQVGQLLRMPDGTVAPVTGVFPQGKQPLYKVTFADGRSTLAGGPHLWTVFSHRWGRQGSRGIKTVTTEDLIRYLKECEERNYKPWYNIFVPTITHPDVENKELPIDPYLLGVLLGDGCISQGSGMVTSSDMFIIEECQQILNKNHNQNLVLQEYSNSNGYDWGIRSLPGETKSIRSCLQQLNLYGCISNTKFIPQEYIEGTSKQQKLDLLAGLLDTDGTVGKTKNVSFCSVSERLANDVQYIVRSLGGKATITTRTSFYRDDEGNKINGQLAYNVSIRYPTPQDLFRLPRKKDLLTAGETQYANEGLRVVSVERVEDGEAQCIMVDHPDHLYITDDFIVTHNTVLLNALVYAVYDKPVSNISKDNLVNNINKKNMEVAVEFQKDGKTYSIVRARKTKAGAAGNHVHLYESGKDVTPDSVSNTNAEIEKIIGIPYELFVRIVAFSATHTPFLDLPVRSPYAANQTDIIEELFDLKTLSEKASILKEHIKEAEQSLTMHKARVEQLEKERARHEKQLQSAEQRVLNWQQSNHHEIEEIETKLKKIDDIDFEEQSSLHEQLSEIDRQLREAIEWHQKTEKNLTALEKKRDKIQQELEHLRDEQCPYCLQKYDGATEKISENETKLKDLIEAIESEERLLIKAEDDVETKASLHKEIKGKITVKNLKELMDIRGKQDQYKARLDDLRQAENPFLDPLRELEEIELDKIDMSKINELTKLVDHQKFLLKLLTKKDSFVRKALLNKNIPFLNQRLQHYLTQLGLSHTVEFTHEMTASISQFGRPLDFGNLSNGQRARVNIALSFAFRDVLQSIHDHINVCMLDEVLDVGLDAIGVQAAARMLKHKARDEGLSMYVISHRDEIDSAFDHRMTVQMSKGFSYIKFED